MYIYILFSYNYLVSDTCANGEKVDESGPRLVALISDTDSTENVLKGEVSCTAIVPDDEALIMVAAWIYFIYFIFCIMY